MRILIQVRKHLCIGTATCFPHLYTHVVETSIFDISYISLKGFDLQHNFHYCWCDTTRQRDSLVGQGDHCLFFIMIHFITRACYVIMNAISMRLTKDLTHYGRWKMSSKNNIMFPRLKPISICQFKFALGCCWASCWRGSNYRDVTWESGVSFHQLIDCLFKSLHSLTAENITSTLLTLCAGNPPVTDGFPSEKASNSGSMSISWHHLTNNDQAASPYNLQWHHNEHNDVPNHRQPHCLVNYYFRRTSKKISKLRDTVLCEGNPPVTGRSHSHRASNAKNISIWWRHHDGVTVPQWVESAYMNMFSIQLLLFYYFS